MKRRSSAGRAALLLGIVLALSRRASAQTTPISDLGSTTYLGFSGGLYENGSNVPPADHLAAGLTAAAAVQPLDTAGNPSPSGKVVLVSVGMSNTTQEFCSGGGLTPCDSWTFVGQASADPAVNHSTLFLVNGARGSQTAATWDSPMDANYDRVRDTDLVNAGATEAQVQVAWVKVANPGPTVSLPAANSDASALVTQMGNIVRALKTRYPNLKLVYLSSRIYAGYATTALNPEPYAYESGFAVKWLVQAQVDQMRAGGTIVDPRAGDLNRATGAPWVGWSAYLWANGTTPRSDGLVWLVSDLAADGTHPSQSGRQKVGTLLLAFFKSDSTSRPWFLATGAGARFHTLTPCRVADTRDPAGSWGGPALAANAERTFMLSGRCGIPATARAAAVNLTVTQASADGDLRARAAGDPSTLVSTINYRAAQTRANNAILPIGAAGGVTLRCVQASGSAHTILDVFGFFE
ncbi:MAG: hypothetical protein H7X85_05945 [Thermoanaerobaculia bacterium]|nr:hypothetical protein [Thermoanaerobaculia bacterium]